MPVALDEFRTKLISNIQVSQSQEEVGALIDGAMAELERNEVNGHIIVRFVDKIIDQLETFSPMKKDAQQWSNINMARVLFNRIKNSLKSGVA